MRKPFWTYLACCIAVFMISMDNLMVTNALPVISAKLHTGLEGLEWTVNGYTLTFAVLLLTGAALGDRYGRRRMLVVGMSVFTVGSAASALAPSIGVLIAARAVQGARRGDRNAADRHADRQRHPAAHARHGAGPVERAPWVSGRRCGPVIGGAVTDAASWQWIFWINVPVGIAVLPLLLLTRESRSGAGRLDPAGVILATAGLFGIVFGLIRANSHGWTSAQVLGSLAGGGLLLVAFGAWESRAATPMLPLSLFRSRGFSAASATMLLTQHGHVRRDLPGLPVPAVGHGLHAAARLASTACPGPPPPPSPPPSPACSPTASAAGGSSPSASRCRRSASAGSPPRSPRPRPTPISSCPSSSPAPAWASFRAHHPAHPQLRSRAARGHRLWHLQRAAPGRHRAGHRRARLGLLRHRRPGQPWPVHHRPDRAPSPSPRPYSEQARW